MSVYGAVYGGAGYVRFLGTERPAATISAQLPNVVFSPGRVQAHLFGSGWGERADAAKVLADAAEQGLPAVVDADGLGYLPKPAPANWLLTPHAGELAKLLERKRSWVEEDPVRAVTAGAQQTGSTVLLKGATQLVAAPDDPTVLVAVPGPAWTAQAGSGDVLGGVCAALLAAGVPPAGGPAGASVRQLPRPPILGCWHHRAGACQASSGTPRTAGQDAMTNQVRVQGPSPLTRPPRALRLTGGPIGQWATLRCMPACR
jgi:NAD(P)H-hydrate repair Nnr-like enzyme with NAD(P)H-hydrate dehydratase domain